MIVLPLMRSDNRDSPDKPRIAVDGSDVLDCWEARIVLILSSLRRVTVLVFGVQTEILQMNPKPASMFAFSRPSCKPDARCRPLPAPRVTRALGRGSDLAISPAIWTHSFCRLLLNA